MEYSTNNGEHFGGNKKVGTSLLHFAEQQFIKWAVPKVPKWIHSYHLTLATIPISLAIIGFSYVATINIHWFWAVSALIALQWLTDSLDGAIGRSRKEGLIKWGYYMDHFLDYMFLCAVVIGYSVLLPDQFKYLHFFIFALFGAFMVNSYLSFAATNEFRVAYLKIGPTEVRILFIIINTLIILFGKTYLAFSIPYAIAFTILGLFIVVYRTHKYLWKIDMAYKHEKESKE